VECRGEGQRSSAAGRREGGPRRRKLGTAAAAVGDSSACPAGPELQLQEGQDASGRGGNGELELHSGAGGLCLASSVTRRLVLDGGCGGRPEANGGEFFPGNRGRGGLN
jgi:hypothetical protein